MPFQCPTCKPPKRNINYIDNRNSIWRSHRNNSRWASGLVALLLSSAASPPAGGWTWPPPPPLLLLLWCWPNTISLSILFLRRCWLDPFAEKYFAVFSTFPNREHSYFSSPRIFFLVSAESSYCCINGDRLATDALFFIVVIILLGDINQIIRASCFTSWF